MSTRSSDRRVEPRATGQPLGWLRASYWTGAVIDGLAALQMLIPSIFATMNQLPDFHSGVAYQYAMGMGASLMLGGSGLLLWADRKPIERKGVLLLTVFPVIAGLVATEVWAVGVQFLPIGAVAPIWALQAALIVLFTVSYMKAKAAEA